ncbi:hypothetical protein [Agromyces sp. CCNWLW203]|uniref:hypothetical protein n=1 Tax=Agromyces sp. CCNWLW203 TaxID=3112842 RepID=UPI002F96C4BC
MRPLRLATLGAASALALAAVLLPAQAAMAAPTASFTPTVVVPGGTIDVTGAGCPAGGEVVVGTWIPAIGGASSSKTTTVTADGTGAFSATVAVHGAPGELPEITPPIAQFGVTVTCDGAQTVIGFGALTYAGAPLTAVLTPSAGVVPGESFTVNGSGCDAAEAVFIAVDFPGPPAVTHFDDTAADASGNFSFVVPTPVASEPGDVIVMAVSCGSGAPVEDPADYITRTLTFAGEPVDPVDPVDPIEPVDPPVPPAPGAAPAGAAPAPAAAGERLAESGTDLGPASAGLALLLAGGALVGLRRLRRGPVIAASAGLDAATRTEER